MKDQKAENLLNLALSVPEEERKQTGELDVGYDRETRTWELIVKYSGDLAGIVREQFPEAELKELSGGFGILTVPEEEVPGILELKEIEYAEKPKRLFFAINQAKAASCLTLVQQGPEGLTGRGVLVGILDSGIDYFHGDFRHEDGTSRILFLNDQVTGDVYTKEEIIRITLNNIDDVLGYSLFYGSKGLKNIPKYSNFANVFLCVVITCFLIHAMMKSRHGRAVLAIRDNEIAAESCGIQTTYYKVMAFAFSAAFAGLAGGLYACYIGVLNPSTFGFMKSIEILVMVVLGGMGSMLGSILSATVLTILPEATRSFDSYRMVIYSLVLVLMMIFRPGGLLGSYDFSMSRIVEKVMNGELFHKKNADKEGADHE